jgi:phosphoserine phosphatase
MTSRRAPLVSAHPSEDSRMNEKPYILFGTGPDAVGLVQEITTPIAEIGGNVIDLRQDVLHGLFTIFLVVDFAASSVSAEAVQALVRDIGERTGLDLRLDQYQPVARSAEKVNLLLILVGRDRPGIIAAVSDTLSAYQVNIELSQMIAREGIFLMELLLDVSRSTLPRANLEATLREHMSKLGIDTRFQSQDVFNKKKRILVFELTASLMDGATRAELLRQAGVSAQDWQACYAPGDPEPCLSAALARIDGLPIEVVERLSGAAAPTPGTVELIQTLKTMGYQVALVSHAFTLVTDRLLERLGLDHAFGVAAPIDEDAMTFSGPLSGEDLATLQRERVLAELQAREGVAGEDISLISDQSFGEAAPPGIHLVFDVRLFLDLLNQHVLSPESLTGVLGAFGPPIPR